MTDTSAKSEQSFESSSDAIFGGRLILTQPARGYRFSVDAPLLVAFAASGSEAQLCADLGAGCGVVGLGLLAAGAANRVVAVEIQPRLANCCRINAAANSPAGRFELIEGDLRESAASLATESFDLITINPPFWPSGSGRLPENDERRNACHELLVSLEEWVAVARNLIHPRRGRCCVVFPARRLDDLLLAFARNNLSGTRLRPVYPRAGEPAELVLVEARWGGAGRLVVEPPLVLAGADGGATKETQKLLDGQFSKILRSLPDRRTGSA